MTKQEEQNFKRLIKEGTLEVLISTEGKNAIKEGALEALRSEEGQDILTDNFVKGFDVERRLGMQTL